MSYVMKKVAEISGHSLYARKSDKIDQSFSDYIFENNVYGDGRPSQSRLCLLKNCHSIYFEIWVDGKYSQRVGLSQMVDLANGWSSGVNDTVNQILANKIKMKSDEYKSFFQKV